MKTNSGYAMEHKYDPAWLASKLFSHRQVDQQTRCWLWTGTKDSKGYGLIMIRGVRYRVHRLAASLWNGFDLGSDLGVLHICDEPACFNPHHLFEGTPADNNADMWAKGRAKTVAPGTPGLGQKLTGRQVAQIRAMLAEGHTLRAVGKAFNVSHETIRLIRDKTTWRHIP